MIRGLLWLLGLILLAYLGLCALLFHNQRGMLYFPQAVPLHPGHRTIALPLADANVRVSVRELPGSEALVYFGGNAEDVTTSLPVLAEAFPNRSLYLLHYRGYGGSSGQPSESALASDALVLFDLVHARHADVTVAGRSLGSGLALRVASQRPVQRVVLITPYDSLQAVAAAHYPFFPVRWLMRDKFESWRYAPQVSAPTLLIVAEHDEVIPPASAHLLATRFRKGIATVTVLPGVSHNSVSQHPEYVRLLRGPGAVVNAGR